MTVLKHGKLLCLMLALILGLSMPIFGGDLLPQPADAVPIKYIDTPNGDSLFAWTNDTLKTEELQALFSGQTLYPQKTGYLELDALLEEIFARAGENADTYTKFRCLYDFLVKEVTYSWRGYGYTYASVKSYNSFYLDYLKDLHYEDGLQKSIPDDMANRAYHIMSQKKGVCYDYAIALAVGARYLGLDSYVRTGYFYLENASGGLCHHGWTVVMLGEKEYLFDGQRDARNYEYYGRNGYYFGIPQEKTYRYLPNYSTTDSNSNALLASQMLPVAAQRTRKVEISVTTEGTGTVTGNGSYITGETATLSAEHVPGHSFLGWYQGETLLWEDKTYTFPVTDDVEMIAKFDLCPAAAFQDVDLKAWYHGDVDRVVAAGIMTGTSLTKSVFDPADPVTRATVTTILYRMSGAEFTPGESPFEDVAPGAWYYGPVLWAYENGVVEGNGTGGFDPDEPVTREQLMLMLSRYTAYMAGEYEATEDLAIPEAMPDYPEISPWALEGVNWGYGRGLIRGRVHNMTAYLEPQGITQRCELASVICRYLALAEAA